MSGLLIVNADDFGSYPKATESILACFEAGAITSTTAFAFTTEAEGAAKRAVDAGLVGRIGLHLNLRQPHDDVAPAPLRAQQAALVEHFADLQALRWKLTPRLRGDIAEQIAAQLAEFRRCYGAEPTHVDSHQHAHAAPDVFLSPGLPRGIKLRRPLDFAPGAPAARPERALRAIKQRVIGARFRTTDRSYRISELLPELGAPAGRLEAVAAELDAGLDVEIMCHPSYDRELPVLLGEQWRGWLRERRHGSFAQLAG